MKEHPILFTGAMVRAILEGRKTQTRRPVKAPKGSTIATFKIKTGGDWQGEEPRSVDLVATDRNGHVVDIVGIKRPFAVGDRLWVRETFSYLTTTEERHYNDMEGRSRCSEYDRVLTPEDFADGPLEDGLTGPIAYKASHTDEEIKLWGVHREMWRPSIHMPRAASRLTLEVTAIRPERVQDIGETDAIAEGLTYLSKDGRQTFKFGIPDRDGWPGTDDDGWPWKDWDADPRKAFERLWDGIYGEGPLAWKHNPWTWAVTFKVVTP